ncbi:molybdenum cofactor biosynthesis protein MoaE [Arhodomonas aquaeolei]|uniref:molybdenum cofactor biosynthesis protein MoaE n=1 Tax=Arhodomonas aquaeolei TaxID=2369 RepID=UPI00036F4FD2|nr:molybdenum cofactor biosynthesis protein MoaE [Arhodomonas aquaeolei]
MTHLTEEPLSLADVLAETDDPRCGALVVFEGVVRDHHDGRGVSAMEYTAYAPLARRELADLEAETRERFGVPVCRIVHRTGRLEIGEASVIVVVRAPHRGDAFDAARYAIDTLKQRVPIWKHDFFDDGGAAWQDGTSLGGRAEDKGGSQ